MNPEPAPGAVADLAVTVVSRSHLPQARVMAASLTAHEPRLPLVAVVADLGAGESLELPGAECVAAAALGIDAFGWLALKYTPWELCCALKPHAVAHALARGARRVVYLDADIRVHDSLASLTAPLEHADWVVTPHQRVPFDPDETAGHIPSAADLERCGRLNAGLFALRDGPAVREFLAWWSAEVAAPGAFDGLWLGGRTEQQLFARVLDAAGSVAELDRPEHNVAYWNLHERPLTVASGRYRVDGVPLATFHWSGFDPGDPERISRYDSRHLLGEGGALDRLASQYREALADALGPPAPGGPSPWRWDRTLSGAPVDARVRALVRRYETRLAPAGDPYSAAGERRLAHALLAPLADTGTLLPLLFVPIYDERTDLRAAFPEAPLSPERFRGWIAGHGAREHHYERWLELARSFDGADAVPALVPLGAARAVWNARPDLRRAFPAPLAAGAPAFARWLEHWGRVEHGLPAASATALRSAGARGGAWRASTWLHRRADVIGGAAEAGRRLLAEAVAHGELELDDVVAWLWQGEMAE
jgi:hypothetical protein